MNTNQQPEKESPQPSALARGLMTRPHRWTRRALSPWVQHRLHPGTVVKSARPSRATLTARHVRGVLERLRHRPTSGSPQALGPGSLLAGMTTRLAGAILNRHRAIRPIGARRRTVSAARPPAPPSELVLAGSSPSTRTPLYSGAELAQMPVPGTLPPDQFIPPLPPIEGGFSAGQRIPPMQPTESGFTVGQRIPPMPKSDPKKQPPAGKKSKPQLKPKPAEGQKPVRKRIYSRVEEVLPPKPAAQPADAPPAAAKAEPPAVEQRQTEPPPGDPQTVSEPAVASALPEGAAPQPTPPTGPQVPQTETGPRPTPERPRQEQAAEPPAAAHQPQPSPAPEMPPDPLVQHQALTPERETPQPTPPAGPQVLPQTETGPRPTPERPQMAQAAKPPATAPQPPTALETPPVARVQRQEITPEGDALKPAPPAGPQVLPQAETGPRPTPERSQLVQTSEPPVTVPQPPAQLETPPVAPGQRQTLTPERDEPDVVQPAGPQQIQAKEIGQPNQPETLPRQKRAEPPATAPQSQPPTAPEMPPVAPTAPRSTGSQMVPQPATGPRPTPEPPQLAPAAEPPPAAPQPQPPDAPVQRQVSPPEWDKPKTAQATGPQAVPRTKTGSRPTPERSQLAQTTEPPTAADQPMDLSAEAPEMDALTSPGQPDAGASRPAARKTHKPKPPAIPPARQPAPAEATVSPVAEELPVAQPRPGPAAPTQRATALHQTGPEPVTASPSSNLAQALRRRAVTQAQLPLHQPQSRSGPNRIARQTITRGRGLILQPLARSGQDQRPATPQPLARGARFQPSVFSEPRPHTSDSQDQWGRLQPAGLSSAAPPPGSAGVGASNDPHLAALRAIERQFGPAALRPAQERLAGLAGLGQPVTKTPPPRGPEPVAVQPEGQPGPQPFDIDHISLGQPKVKVMRRQPAKSGVPADKKTQPAPVARRISQGRSPLVLARKSGRGKGGSGASQSKVKEQDARAPRSGSKTRLIQPDLSRLAQAVYPLVKRLIAIERERRPGY